MEYKHISMAELEDRFGHSESYINRMIKALIANGYQLVSGDKKKHRVYTERELDTLMVMKEQMRKGAANLNIAAKRTMLSIAERTEEKSEEKELTCLELLQTLKPGQLAYRTTDLERQKPYFYNQYGLMRRINNGTEVHVKHSKEFIDGRYIIPPVVRIGAWADAQKALENGVCARPKGSNFWIEPSALACVTYAEMQIPEWEIRA